MDWIVDHLANISKIAGYVAAILSFSYGFWKWVARPIYKHFAQVSALRCMVETIYEEVTPNGGGSIKDAVRRIESQSGDIEAKLVSLQHIHDAYREDDPIGIFECTTEGENLHVNRTYARWLGVSKTDLLRFGWVNFIPEADRLNYKDHWSAAFLEGRELEFEISLESINKELIHCSVWAYPIADKRGEVVQYLGIMRRIE